MAPDNVINLEQYRTLVAQRERIPKGRYFINLWKIHNALLSSEQKDGVGRSYLRHIVGVDEPTIKAFLEGDGRAQNLVGLRDGYVPGNFPAFWDEVAEITKLYSPEDVTWLKGSGASDFPALMTLCIDTLLDEKSRVLGKLNENSQAYK